MTFDGKSRRVRERVALNLPVRVLCREASDHEWVEMSRLIDVTPFGARFPISHPTEPGRLLHLTMPMPRQLRCFDHVEDTYRVWALVRNLRSVPPVGNQVMRFEVGVAFIGKRPPTSYENEPNKRYEIARSAAESSVWKLQEDADLMVSNLPSSDQRIDTRHNIPINVTMQVIDQNGAIASTENTVTENISRRGAAVMTTINVPDGRFVRLSSDQYGIAVLSAVRGRRVGSDGVLRLHLEFIDRDWPLGGED
ncbi:MAG: hypothetical protein QOD75_3718 [Blastocatellia bacterium]|jgi:hypothetical protein|nr:hypothetical protein [Blastocatellia bacterium]